MVGDSPRHFRWSPAHVGRVLEAAARLMYARRRLPGLTFTKLPAVRSVPVASAAQLAQARRLARAVAAASNRSPVTLTCVHQSLALWWMMSARGISGELRIGVKNDTEPFAAHAWVQCASEALNETPESVGRYRAFTEAVVPEARRAHPR
jgi:hypothetical protein